MINDLNRDRVIKTGKWSMFSGWFFVGLTLIVLFLWLLDVIV